MLNPAGVPEAEILFVGDAPNGLDIKNDEVWTGPAGDIMRAEFRKAGISSKNIRVTNMWRHPKTKDCNFEAYHLTTLLHEMMNRKLVVLMGAEACKYFTDENVSDMNGLVVTSEMIPSTVGKTIAMFNPALALHDRLGEIRFAINVVAETMK